VLRRDRENAASAELRLSVEITQSTDTGFELVVRAHHPEGELERTLNTKTCGEAVEAAALVVALAVDPSARTESEPEAEVPEKPAPPARVRVRSSLLGGLLLGELPRAAPWVGADTGVDFRGFGAIAEVFWAAQQRALVGGDETGRGGQIGTFGGGLAVCYSPIENEGRLSACLALRAGAWTAKGNAVANPQSHLTPWFGSGARVRYVLPVTDHLGILVSAEATYLFERPEFFLADLGAVFKPPHWGARFGSGLQVAF